MTGHWFGTSRFPIVAVSRAFELRLGKMLQNAPASSFDLEVPYLNSASVQWGGVVEAPDQVMWVSPSERSVYGVEQGDLLICEGGDAGRSAIYDGPPGVVIQNSLHRARARAGSDVRYLGHVMAALHGSGFLDVLCNKATIRHFTAEKFASLPIPLPSLGEQQRIADFLDEQVAVFDEVIALRKAQLAALEERIGMAADVALAERGWRAPSRLEVEAIHPLPDNWRVVRLSQTLHQLTNGYVGPTRDILVEEGIRYVQGMHIKGGRIDFDRRHFFVAPEWHAARPRIHLREGDVLIVQTGDIGRVAVVPPDFGDASCHALQIARVRPEILSGEYLGAFLGSSFGYHSLLSRATGALHPHLEGGIRSVPVIVPPHVVQRQVVAEVSAIRRAAQAAQTEMRAQIALLQQRKHSMITAAVTGQFDVSAARKVSA